jgi:hypothetical protein
MKSLNKYAILAALFSAVIVEAQTAPPPRTPSMTEMREQSEKLHEQIEADNRHVLHLQAVARKEKDVIKLTCINDKLVQIKAQMNLFDTASLQLESQLSAEADEPARMTTFSELEQAGAEVKALRGQADGCAGELDLYKQESRSDFERPELDDPTQGGPFNSPEQTGETIVEPPGYATPFK